ncbi:MAG: hypothetical protein CO189_09620 [candidate division Zixibacteria bacterium CG_4_9_14_3_um_filter_46_8]|nr:MAG: hypothetical protein CO189_09620 [candidate division Zixibacteria bacterium CG_4_9_14_3_um_filter_46_8]
MMKSTLAIDSSLPQTEKTVRAIQPEKELKQRQKVHELKKACSDFQAIFLSYMLKTMRESVPKSGFLGDGFGGELFTDLFDMKISESLSGAAGLGLDETLFRQLAPNAFGEDWKEIAKDINSLPRKGGVKVLNSAASPASFGEIVNAAATKYDLEPALIDSVITAESGGNHLAVSNRGAKGLMQLTDSTSQHLGVADPFDPNQNIHGGARYLRELLDRYNGDLRLALAAYNAGPTTVDKYQDVPPYKETQLYVNGIMERLHNDRP